MLKLLQLLLLLMLLSLQVGNNSNILNGNVAGLHAALVSGQFIIVVAASDAVAVIVALVDAVIIHNVAADVEFECRCRMRFSQINSNCCCCDAGGDRRCCC